MEETVRKIGESLEKDLDKFGGRAKLAADLAALLDGGLLDPAKGQSAARARQDVLGRLRALCLDAGVTPPPGEPETVRALIPEAKEEVREEARRISELIGAAVDGRPGTEAVRDLAGLGRVIRLLPALLERFGDSRQTLTASADLLLMSLGLEPLPPGDDRTPEPAPLPEPARPLKVLIVDDGLEEIVRTFRALAGAPGLAVGALQVDIDWGSDRETALRQTAEAVLAAKPDIVLMDQGMPVISGSELIGAIRGLPAGDGIVFVGNTGGSPDELNDAGAIGNCDKGRHLSPVVRAINRFAR